MSVRFKRKILWILSAMFLLAAICFAGCSSEDEQPPEETEAIHGFIMPESSYRPWIEDWAYREVTGANDINDSAESMEERLSLQAHNSYYFVYIFQGNGFASAEEVDLPAYFSFRIKADGTVYSGNEAVELLETDDAAFGQFVHMGEGKDNGWPYWHISADSGREGIERLEIAPIGNEILSGISYTAPRGGTESDTCYFYAAVKFSPLHEGTLYVESCIGEEVYEYQTYGEEVISSISDNVVTANVSDAEDGNSLEVEVSNLNYGTVTEENYRQGLINKDTVLTALPVIDRGTRYYAVFEFDVAPLIANDGTEDVYFGLAVSDARWFEPVLEQAATSDTKTLPYGENGTLFEFGYSIPEDPSENRHFSIVVSFITESTGSSEIEFFVYGGDNSRAVGTVYAKTFVYEGLAPYFTFVEGNDNDYYINFDKTLIGDAEELVIPDTYNRLPVTNVYRSTDLSETNLKRVQMGANMQSFSAGLFENCARLEEVILSESCETIAADAFNGCVSLKQLTNIRSVKEISPRAFKGCTALESVDLSAAESIGSSAFENCTALTQVTFGNRLVTVEDRAFYGCRSLESAKFQSLSAGPTVGEYYFRLGEYVFAECSALQSVQLPNFLTDSRWRGAIIGAHAFENCTALELIYLDYRRTLIREYAFAGCGSLAEVEGTRWIDVIGDYAFENCSSLTELVLDKSVETGENSFSGCDNLQITYGD